MVREEFRKRGCRAVVLWGQGERERWLDKGKKGKGKEEGIDSRGKEKALQKRGKKET